MNTMLSKFCCCCNLRSGSIVFIWFQLMCIVIIIGTLSSPLMLANLRFIPESPVFVFLNPVFTMVITTQVIKIGTCFSLIWGLIKKNPMFYHPWLFVQGTENVLISIFVLIAFISGLCGMPILLGVLIPFAFMNGLLWYFWASIYAVYKIDINRETSEDYEALTMTSSVVI